MGPETPMLHEFIARKEQVLNLEIRLLVLVLIFELLFIFVHVYTREFIRSKPSYAAIALSVQMVLLLVMIATNGKMGLISQYLRQFEAYLASLGYKGAIWESKALDMLIFVPGNAFTLPAGLAVLLLVSQGAYAIYAGFDAILSSRWVVVLLTVLGCVVLLYLVVKAVTVDFRATPPAIF